MPNGNVNLGLFGFDWNEHGGGFTIGGIRIGGGKNGAEIGTNLGIGAQVNGQGVYAGGGAKVTIGGDGVQGSAGVKANLLDQRCGAGAKAGLKYDGNFYSDAVSTTSSEVSSARGKLDQATKDLKHVKFFLTQASDKYQSAKNALDQAKKSMVVKEDRLNSLRTKRNTAAVKKTNLLNSKTDKTTELDYVKQQLESAKSRLNRATADNRVGEILREQGAVEKQTALIFSLEAGIKEIDAELKPLLEDLKQSEEALQEAQEAVTLAKQEYMAKHDECEERKKEYVGAERRVKEASDNVEKKTFEHSKAVDAYNKAKEEQRMYETSM